jgi:hypothetical protein
VPSEVVSRAFGASRGVVFEGLPKYLRRLPENSRDRGQMYPFTANYAATDHGKGAPISASLYDRSVPTFLQTMRAIGGFLGRAAAHCAETGANPGFRECAPVRRHGAIPFPARSGMASCVWGVEALKTGAFTPPGLVGRVPFVQLQAMIAEGERR